MTKCPECELDECTLHTECPCCEGSGIVWENSCGDELETHCDECSGTGIIDA